MMPVKKFMFDLVDHHFDHSTTRTHQKYETIHFLYDKVCAIHKHITILFFSIVRRQHNNFLSEWHWVAIQHLGNQRFDYFALEIFASYIGCEEKGWKEKEDDKAVVK
jgi:hypothetical protein